MNNERGLILFWTLGLILVVGIGLPVYIIACWGGPGERVTANGGFPGVIVRQYDGSMYEVRLPGGLVCIDAADIQKVAKGEGGKS